MVDLFTGIPDELIESTLQTIWENLDKVGLFGGHTLRKHIDIQLMVLKNRLTKEDIRYATSYWDVNVAAAVASGLMRKFYDSDIVFWLKNSSNDYISLIGHFPQTIGYGFRKGEDGKIMLRVIRSKHVIEKISLLGNVLTLKKWTI